jgi:hypothetical protein
VLKTADFDGATGDLERLAAVTSGDGGPVAEAGRKRQLSLHLELDVGQRAEAAVGKRLEELGGVGAAVVESEQLEAEGQG